MVPNDPDRHTLQPVCKRKPVYCSEIGNRAVRPAVPHNFQQKKCVPQFYGTGIRPRVDAWSSFERPNTVARRARQHRYVMASSLQLLPQCNEMQGNSSCIDARGYQIRLGFHSKGISELSCSEHKPSPGISRYSRNFTPFLKELGSTL